MLLKSPLVPGLCPGMQSGRLRLPSLIPKTPKTFFPETSRQWKKGQLLSCAFT